MNQSMRLLSSFESENKKDSLKYAYAFMLCKRLYIKECNFFNPNPKQSDSEHVFSVDVFSAVYSENDLPPWEEFRSSLIHFSSPSFSCVGSLDQADQKRLTCVSIEAQILFGCYGSYEAEAKKIISEILKIRKTLE